MAFCPICKNEYRAGVLICPDCNCDLVDQLTNDEKPVLYIRSEHIMNRFTEYLSDSGIHVRVAQEPEDDRYAICCDPSDNERVKRAFSVFVAVEAGNAMASRSNKPLEEATEITESDLKRFQKTGKKQSTRKRRTVYGNFLMRKLWRS